MPHPPVLRGIQQIIHSLQKAGHTVVPWQPLKHQHSIEISTGVFSVDGGAAVKRVLALNDEPPIANVQITFQSNRPMVDLVSFWKLQNDKYAYQKEYLAQWQQQSHIDGWISPVAPHAAVKHDEYKYYGYSTVINVLDWPAVTIPVTFADKTRDIKDMQYQARNELDAEIYEKYDADIYDGAPVGVQLVGRRLQEDYLLGLAEQINDAINSLA